MAELDLIAVEVLRNRLISIAYEMGHVLRRTGHSPNIRDREDCSCVLADANGLLIAQAEHIPGHLGILNLAMAETVRRFPRETLAEGDVVIFNEPYEGGGHLPDIRIVVPIFYAGELVGFSANMAHHADVGGMAPGSMPATSVEIIQEGVMIPYLKLYRQGVLNDDLLQLFLANVRTPAEREGDLKAQVAAAQLGRRRVVETIERLGLERWEPYKEEILNQSERLMRAQIRHKLPRGTFRAVQYIDDDGTSLEPIKIQVAVTVEGDRVIVDFAGTDPQRRAGVNCLHGQTLAATYLVVKGVVDPTIPVNAGCYRPIELHIPTGTVIRPNSPGATAASPETMQRVSEAVIAALAQADPTLVKASSHGCMNNVVFGGQDPRTGQAYAYYETIAGGDGARFDKDGMDGVHVLNTNTLNTPAEVLETTFPLRVEEYSLRPDSGGLGQYRGGLGIKRRYRVLDHTATLVVNTDWIRDKPPGLDGGEAGALTRLVLNEGTDREEVPPFAKFIRSLPPDGTFTVYTGGGAGYGPPSARDAAAADRDRTDEKIS